ncbi:MAG: response regulator transcription factor [Rhodocyclaceae bacterium]|nr:MAG: response regulator transcription factor [Rhodocyclaceae bacterium]
MTCRSQDKWWDGSVTNKVIRIVLADDHAVVRTGYRRLLELEPGFEVVAEFPDGEAVYQWLKKNTADVLILDLSMPGRGGLETLLRLRACGQGLAVLIFTMHDAADMVSQALQAGATGYVTKSSHPDVLVAAVRSAALGVAVFSDDVAGVAKVVRQTVSPPSKLSLREFEIFRLLAQGREVAEIADRLCLSEKTIFNYQTTIRQKTGLNSVLDMHKYASRCRLIPP